MKSMRKCLAILLAASMVMGLTACGQTAQPAEKPIQKETQTEQGNDNKDAEIKPDEEIVQEETGGLVDIEAGMGYEIAENTTGEEVRIAAITVNNNPFWVDVEKGLKDIKEVMAQDKYNCTVDIITVDDFDGQVFSDTINNCIVKEYDAITTVGVSDAIIPAINKAVDSGIPVYTFNSDTAGESKRTAFHGQDLYEAGKVAAEALVKLMGENGKVAIITGLFSVNAHELRRTGGMEVFDKYEGIEVVGEVECHDSNDEAYAQTKDFITANPDLKGIYCTAAGQIGAAKAVKELGLQDQVNIVCFDYMQEVIDAIYDGTMKATIGQDPYGQGAHPVIFAYNEKITGKAEYTGNVWTKMDVVTKENVAEFFPR